jgi:hypothetical protein
MPGFPSEICLFQTLDDHNCSLNYTNVVYCTLFRSVVLTYRCAAHHHFQCFRPVPSAPPRTVETTEHVQDSCSVSLVAVPSVQDVLDMYRSIAQFSALTTRLPSRVHKSVYMWCLNDKHKSASKQCVLCDYFWYCICINNECKVMLNMHDGYMHCILYSNGHIANDVLALSVLVVKTETNSSKDR